MIRLLLILSFVSGILFPQPSIAMICTDQRQNVSFMIDEYTGFSYQIGLPQNQGQSFRDPTGQFYMRLPAINPQVDAFFAAWDGRLVYLNAFAQMPQIIGICQQQANMPAQPQYQIPNLSPSNYQVIGAPPNSQRIPARFAPAQPGYAQPAYATEQQMVGCAQQSQGDRSRFMDCAARQMFSPQQTAIYDCVSKSADDAMRAQCLAAQVLGPNEQRAIQQVQTCYSQSGGDWSKLPLCMASQQFDPNTQRAIGCIQEQAQSGQVSAWGTVACVGANNLNMNPEMTIAVQCAATTGGDPMGWAGCTGGQLTQRELTKCITNGVGGPDGCFGPNNTIVQGLNQLGQLAQNQFGPNNDAVRHFNNAVSDLQNGPGQNNDIGKAMTTIANDLSRGPGPNNDIRKFANNVLPGIW